MARPKRPSDVWPVLIRLNVPVAAKLVFQAQRDYGRKHQGNTDVPEGDRGTLQYLRAYLEGHLKGVFVRTERPRKSPKP